MLFSPFTCNSFDVCLKHTLNPSVKIQKLVDLVVLDLFWNLTRNSPGAVSSEVH